MIKNTKYIYDVCMYKFLSRLACIQGLAQIHVLKHRFRVTAVLRYYSYLHTLVVFLASRYSLGDCTLVKSIRDQTRSNTHQPYGQHQRKHHPYHHHMALNSIKTSISTIETTHTINIDKIPITKYFLNMHTCMHTSILVRAYAQYVSLLTSYAQYTVEIYMAGFIFATELYAQIYLVVCWDHGNIICFGKLENTQMGFASLLESIQYIHIRIHTYPSTFYAQYMRHTYQYNLYSNMISMRINEFIFDHQLKWASLPYRYFILFKHSNMRLLLLVLIKLRYLTYGFNTLPSNQQI